MAGADRSDELFAECARLVAENATLTAENARLSAENVELRSLVERLEARIAELEPRQAGTRETRHYRHAHDDAEARADANRETAIEANKSVAGKENNRAIPAPISLGSPTRTAGWSTPHPRVDAVGPAWVTHPSGERRGRCSTRSAWAGRAEVTEHVAERRRCECGTETKADFPAPSDRPGLLRAGRTSRRAVPDGPPPHPRRPSRRGILTDLLGVPVSAGFFASLSGEAADGLGNFIDDLRDALADGQSPARMRPRSAWLAANGGSTCAAPPCSPSWVSTAAGASPRDRRPQGAAPLQRDAHPRPLGALLALQRDATRSLLCA